MKAPPWSASLVKHKERRGGFCYYYNKLLAEYLTRMVFFCF
ncbi:arylamine N-acetyltransferase [Sporomusa termitida]